MPARAGFFFYDYFFFCHCIALKFAVDGRPSPCLCQRALSVCTRNRKMRSRPSLCKITSAVSLKEGTKHGGGAQANTRVSLSITAADQIRTLTRSSSDSHGFLSPTGPNNNKFAFASTSVCPATQVITPFFLQSRDVHRQTITVAAGSRQRYPPAAAHSLRLWQLRLPADRGARFSRCVKRLCQVCSPSKCTGSPSWSQSSPINDGPVSSPCDLWAGKWKTWRCSHLYNRCQGASDMDTPRLSVPHQPVWSDGDA